jgi:uncharacterized glyoxalase superfamily protein PhnB
MKFGYAILYVPDVNKAIGFYERAFGMTKGFVHESGGYGELVTGDTKLAFASLAVAQSHGFPFTVSSASRDPLGMEIALVTPDVDAAMKRAVAAGATHLAAAERKSWGQTVGYVRDLNGFLVELCTPMG